mgnify:CR=1 FL=1
MTSTNLKIIDCSQYLIIILSLIIFIIAIRVGYEYYQKNTRESSDIIIGVDLGSSFSGYSILTDRILDFESHDKNQIFYSEVILDKETKGGRKIGKQAHYSRLNLTVIDLYFSHFKKILDKNNEHENTFIESNIPKGEKVKLDFVIMGFLEVLIKQVRNDLELLNLDLKDAKWIIAAPALWNDKGKKYLKNLGNKVQMHNIDIILEPEAASLAIFHDKNIIKYIITGTKYLIIDARGYTVDFSLNKIIENNDIEQLAQPKSFRLGSNYINEKIIEIIKEVYGEENIKNFTRTNCIEWENILENIENIKNNLHLVEAENIKLDINLNKSICYTETKSYFGRTYKTEKDDCYKKYNNINITYNDKAINIPIKLIKDIITHISFDIVSKINKYVVNQSFNLVVLTGGFSNSLILKENIRKKLYWKRCYIQSFKSSSRNCNERSSNLWNYTK